MKRVNDDLAILVLLNEAAKMTSLSRSMLNQYLASGRFPEPVIMGDRRVAFVKAEVLDWIDAKIAARRPPPTPVGIDQLRAKIAQAYQVIAVLLMGPEHNSLDVAMPEGKRALDYFGRHGYDPKSLPFAHPSAQPKRSVR